MSRRAALPYTVIALACALALVVVPGAAAKVRVWVATGQQQAITGSPPGSQDTYHTADGTSMECARNGVPLAAGWSDIKAPMGSVYFNGTPNIRWAGLQVRAGRENVKYRMRAVCATGVGKVVARSAPSAGRDSVASRVSCPSGRLALGWPIVSGPYWRQAVSSIPVGRRGWLNTEGGYARAEVLCVRASAFKNVRTVTRNATFAAGTSTADIKADCRRGTRPISWGYEAALMEANGWVSPDNRELTLRVPFVSAALPSGSRGWSLRFRTPDGQPAVAPAKVGIAVVCATPR